MTESLSRYRKQWADIAGLVSFRVNLSKPLSPADKGRITRHWEAFQALKLRGSHIYRSKDAEKVAKVQAYAPAPRGANQFRVAFVPNQSGERVRVRIQKKGVAIVSEHMHRMLYPFSRFTVRKGELATNPDAVIDRILKADKQSQHFRLTCGIHESGFKGTRKTLAAEVKRWLEQYGDWRQWFKGVIGFRFDKQASNREYTKAKRASYKGRAKEASKRRKAVK